MYPPEVEGMVLHIISLGLGLGLVHPCCSAAFV